MVINEKKIMKRTQRKTIPISIKITPKLSAWLKEKKYSPTGILLEGCKEMGYEGDD